MSPDEIPNSINPAHLSPAERLDEVAEILATGLTRLIARKSSIYVPTAEEIGAS